jgi:hypothetical protein
MSRTTMFHNGVKITASGGGGIAWLVELIALVGAVAGIAAAFRALTAPEPVLDAAIGITFDVAGILGALGLLGIGGWLVYDAAASRAAVRRFATHDDRLDAAAAARLERTAVRPAVDPARLHVPADRLDRTETVPARGDEALEPVPVELDALG